jgi:glutamate carboxypeptidase
MTKIQRYLLEHAAYILSDVERLVRAESPSRNKSAVDECGLVLQSIFAERLCVLPYIVEQETSGNHLLFQVGESQRKIAILGHFDTVWDIGRLAVRHEDGLLFGPGVLDMKGGLVQAIWAVRALVQLDLLNGTEIRFICTSDEEIGSPSSRAWIEEQSMLCNEVLVVEPATSSGALKTQRKGTGRFDVSIRGKAAHAGNNPEEGVSAIQEMAHQIIKIHSLANPEVGTTLNVGIAEGGGRTNVVAEHATLGVDLRIEQASEAERVLREIFALSPVVPGAKIEVTGRITRPPMTPSSRSREMFQAAKVAAQELGFELTEASVGGVSDGNFTAAAGVPTLDGLGSTGAGPHAEHEHIIIADLPMRAALLAELIHRL